MDYLTQGRTLDELSSAKREALLEELERTRTLCRHLDEIIPSDEFFGDYAPYDVDPAGFVNLIRGAEFVLTDSFHGTVFSVIHHKRFATFYRFASADRQSRNSRIDSIFAHLDLKSRLVTASGQTSEILESVPDFRAVDERLGEWREDSWGFLKEALS